MATPTSGRTVRAGWYWNPGRLEVRTIPPEGGELPELGGRWFRVPGWLLLPAVPIVGGLFVVGLPIYGAAVITLALARKALRGGRAAARSAADALSPELRPGEAHLTGAAGEGTAEAGEDPRLDELEEQIRARQAMEAKEPRER
jgi:hypothetical protein